MGWRMIGKPITTAEMSATVPTIYQSVKISSGEPNRILKGLVAGVIFYNAPSFTSLALEIWSDLGGSPGKLIATSTNSHLASTILANEDHAYRLLGFTFSSVPMKDNQLYHVALRASSYTGDSTSHIAWRNSYPDPQYRTGLTLNAAKGAKHPMELSLISAEV